MNRNIFSLVFSKARNMLVVAPEIATGAHKASRSRRRASTNKPKIALQFVFAVGALMGMADCAHASDLALPSGAILDINNGTGPNDASYSTANTWQTYTVSYTAASDGNNYLLFAFRQDPHYWTFGNVSMVLDGTSTNLLLDPTFTQGGTISSQSSLQAPADWGIVYQSGTTPNAAGHWEAPGDGQYSTTNVNSGTAGSWYDGAVGSFDGIYQGVDLIAGDTYTITFTALSNDAANVSGSGSGGVELGVFAGQCVSLSGPVADCTPDNQDFSVAATPGETVNAGGPSATNINATDSAAGLAASPATLLPVFDGGTLVLDGTDLAPYTFTITGNGGTVDLAGQSATISNPIADDTSGVPGSLTIANSGSGGALTLTGVNTYTGATTIDSGATLKLSGAGSIAASSGVTDNGEFDIRGANGNASIAALSGSGTVDLGGNGLTITDGNGGNFSGAIHGSGGVTIDGGTQMLSGTNDYTGGTTLNGGVLMVSSDANLGDASGALTFDGGALESTASFTSTRNIDATGTATFYTDAGTTLTDTAGTITGNGPITKSGSGTLILGADDSAGGVNVIAGTLQLTGAGTDGGEAYVSGGATLSLTGDGSIASASSLVNNGTFDIQGASGDQSITTLIGGSTGVVHLGGNSLTLTNANGEYDGTIDGSGGVTLDHGVEALTGANTYQGGTTLNGGTLMVSSDANLGDASGALNFNGGTLENTASFTTTRDISATGGANFYTDTGTTLIDTVGAITGTGPITKGGGGTLILGADHSTGGVNVGAGTLQLAGVSTDTGATNIASGATLAIIGNGADAVSSSINNSGTFDISQASGAQSITSLAGNGTVALGNNGLTLTDANGNFSGTIGGDGGVTLSGGVEELSGANTYAGGTTLNGGTLLVSSDSNLGNPTGALNFNGGTLENTASLTTTRDINASGAVNIVTDAGTTLTDTAGAITGSGPINKGGDGTLVLGADHSTGGVNVGAGTLQLAGASTDTGATNIASGATLAIIGNGSDAASSSINNSGTFDLSQANGAQSITSLAGNGTVNLGNNGLTLTDANGHFGGTIGGHGGVTLGGGTEVLSGSNTYTGGTTLNGGNLVVSSDANLGAANAPVTFNGGTLTVTQSMTTSRNLVIDDGGADFNTLGGVTVHATGNLSGTGGLVKSGDGTLIVSGDNTFTGGTLIDGGLVQIDSGSSLGTGVILLNGGTLQTTASLSNTQNVVVTGNAGVNVNAGTSTTMAGNIAEAVGAGGCFVKSGAGTLDLTGTAVLANGTCVEQGMLRANGNLTSNVTVSAPGELRGVGVINGPINVSGRLAPGNSPGTLTVTGTVTMQAGSSYEEDIDGLGTGNGAGNYSRLLISGANSQFIANGTLVPLLRGISGNASNSYTPAIGDTYQIVVAQGGIVGQFNALAQPDGLAPHTRLVAFYNVNDNHSIELGVMPDSYASLIAGSGANRNALSLAGALDNALNLQGSGVANSGQSELLYALAGAKAGQLGAVLTNLSGELYADEAAAGRAAGLAMRSDALGHLTTDDSDVSGMQNSHLGWANVTHDGNRWSGDAQASGFQTGTNQTTAGVDLYAGNGTVIGVAASNHDTDVNAGAAQGTIRGNEGIVYGQQAVASVLVDGMVAHGHDTWITRRPDPTGIAGELYSRASGNDTLADITARMPMTVGSARIEPYASVTWQQFDRGAMNEADSPAALQVGHLSATGTRAMLGVNLGSMQQNPLLSEATYRVGAAVGEDSRGLLSPAVQATLEGESFTTRAPEIGRGFVQLQANGTLRLSHAAYLYGGLTDELGARRSSYGVTAGVRVAF